MRAPFEFAIQTVADGGGAKARGSAKAGGGRVTARGNVGTLETGPGMANRLWNLADSTGTGSTFREVHSSPLENACSDAPKGVISLPRAGKSV